MATALLVIDAQTSVLADAWNAEAVIERINSLVSKARTAGAPVIWIRDQRVVPDASIHPDLAAAIDDLQIEKCFCDAFLGTGLGDELSRRSIDCVVVAGLQTEYCVDTTCRRALSDGFDVLLVADGHTTLDTPDLLGAKVIAHHNRTLGKLTAESRRILVVPAGEVSFG